MVLHFYTNKTSSHDSQRDKKCFPNAIAKISGHKPYGSTAIGKNNPCKNVNG